MNKVTPTPKQKRVFKLKMNNPDMPFNKAMLQSGYSPIAAVKPKQNLTETRGWQILIQDYRHALAKQGVDIDKIATKMAKFIDWKDKNGNDDGELQLKATTLLREDLGLIEKKQDTTTITNNTLIVLRQLDDSSLDDKLNTLLEDIKQLKNE